MQGLILAKQWLPPLPDSSPWTEDMLQLVSRWLPRDDGSAADQRILTKITAASRELEETGTLRRERGDDLLIAMRLSGTTPVEILHEHSLDDEVVMVLRHTSSLCLQRSYRCHVARGLFQRRKMFREEKSKINWERMLRNLILELQEMEDEDVEAAASDVLNRVQEMPEEQQREMKLFLLESSCPFALHLREKSSRTIQAVFRGHRVRALLPLLAQKASSMVTEEEEEVVVVVVEHGEVQHEGVELTTSENVEGGAREAGGEEVPAMMEAMVREWIESAIESEGAGERISGEGKEDMDVLAADDHRRSFFECDLASLDVEEAESLRVEVLREASKADRSWTELIQEGASRSDIQRAEKVAKMLRARAEEFLLEISEKRRRRAEGGGSRTEEGKAGEVLQVGVRTRQEEQEEQDSLRVREEAKNGGGREGSAEDEKGEQRDEDLVTGLPAALAMADERGMGEGEKVREEKQEEQEREDEEEQEEEKPKEGERKGQSKTTSFASQDHGRGARNQSKSGMSSTIMEATQRKSLNKTSASAMSTLSKSSAAAKLNKLLKERQELAKKSLKLDLSNASLKEIPPSIFSDVRITSIRILWLEYNMIATLPEAIGDIRFLTQIRLNNNQLKSLPARIGDLDLLQILMLQSNSIATIPAQIERLQSLTHLSLQDNPLTALPVELSRLRRMKKLELSPDHLSFPPPSISALGTKKIVEFLRRADIAWTTQVLDLSGLDLEVLPVDIIHLFPRLQELYINMNKIDLFPLEFHVMTTLVEIRLDSHIMRSPSMEIWSFGIQTTLEFMRRVTSCEKTQEMELRRWNLTSVPQEVFLSQHVTVLTALDLRQNGLQHLPEEFGMLTSLTELYLDSNLLDALPSSLFRLTSLKVASFTMNRIHTIADKFQRLSNLSSLSLDCNELSQLPSSLYKLSSLDQLSLSSNRLCAGLEGLADLGSLRKLNLMDNLIDRLPLSFSQFTNLREIEIEGNIVWSPPKDILAQPFLTWFSYLHQLSAAREQQECFISDHLYVGGVLNLAKFGLSVFPPEITIAGSEFFDLIEMNLDSNFISSLPRDFSKLSNLTILSMRENRFRTLPKSLGKCFSLAEINFENNLLTFLPLDIGNLTGLKRLKLDGNNLTHPPLEIVKLGIPAMIRFLKLFAEASSNGEVAMSGCDLKSFPLAIADVEDIKIVDLSHNYIGRIPAEFFTCSTIVQLDLSYNSLDEIELEMRRMVSLRTLNLAGNRLKEFASSFLQLTNLVNLFLNMNMIDCVPASVQHMTWLKLLNFSNNKIGSLPLEIGKLNSLKTFIMSYNLLTTLPPTIGGMTALTELSVSNNQITRLPPILGVMTSLTEVNIQDNFLDQHPVEVVEHALVMQQKTKQWHNGISATNPLAMWLSRLRTARVTKEFDASNFRLEVIPAEILLSTNFQLLQLKLELNRLSNIPPEISRLSTLTFLNFSHNQLRTLPPSIGTLSNLTVLYLNDNKLTRLPIELGHLSPTMLSRLSISNNRLETPPAEMRSASTAHILRYYLTSEVAMITGVLDWSWCRTLTTMKAICAEVLGWSKLIRVNMDGNDLTVIDSSICLQMPHLEVLEVRRNRISSIPHDLSTHSRLRTLAVSQNRIKVLPRCLARMRSLTSLEIQGLPLTSPCNEITRHCTENILAYLASMLEAEDEQVCILSDFFLSEIPSEVFQLTSLRCLELNRLELTSLPPQLTLLTDLTSLSFSQNRIDDLPIFLSSLTNLTELELVRNKVPVLYPELHALSNLVTWNVFSNPVVSPPFEIIKTILPRRGEAAQTESRQGREGPSPHVVLSFLKALYTARSSRSLSLKSFELIQWPRESYNLVELREVVMDSNLLRVIPDGISTLSNLTSLSLVDNHIKIISEKMAELASLTYLNLEGNKLEAMPAFMDSFPCLRDVSFANNSLTVFAPSIFKCIMIENLNIRGNRLTEIPPEIALLKKLSVLDYRDNAIIFPPEDILSQGLTVMMRFYDNILSCAPACSFRDMLADAEGDRLNLDSFSLARLPLIVYRGLPRPGEEWSEQRVRRDRWAYGMTQLVSLSLSCNLLEELPEGISRFAQLTCLLGSQNELRLVPDTIGSLTGLRLLDLHRNKLQHVPSSISRLSSLTVLNLSQNRLQQLPEGLGHLPQLKSLLAHQNLIFSLPIDLCQSDSMKELTVHDNPLRMPPPEIVARGLRSILDFLSRLFRCQTSNTLDLRALELESIDYEILPIPNLERLLIANNRMQSLTGKVSEGKEEEEQSSPVHGKQPSKGKSAQGAGANAQLVSLKYLNADYNCLRSFPASITALTSLTEISVISNQLVSLPDNLYLLTNLTRLNVVGNPIASLPLEIGWMTNLLKLDIDLEKLQTPPPEISLAGFPRIQKYFDAILRSRATSSVELMGTNLLHVPQEVLGLTSLTRLVLSKNSVEELPTALTLMSRMRDLWLSYNRIRRLPRELCEHLAQLQSLRLDNNDITIIPVQVGNLTSLTELWLEGNNVTILPLEMGNLYLLDALTLDVAEMVSPNPEICERKASLVVRYLNAIYQGRESRVVDLRGLGLKSFPVEIYSIPSITSLYLDGNYFSSLPPSIERLTDLTDLSLKNLQLQSLPFVMGAMTRLVKLSLPFSRYMVNPPYEILLQGTMATLAYIRKSYLCVKETGYMNISGLSLQRLPEDIITLENLQHLQARDNKIMFLSSSIGKMQDLKVLHMHNNGLLYLPAEIGNLQTLIELRIPFNEIKVLPADIKHCFNLRKLSLQHNLLSTVSADVLQSLTNLESLNISRNQIVYVPGTVGCLHALQKLRMDQNQVRSLPSEIGGCSSLTLLSITCNQFSSLPDELSSCSLLTALHISGNRFFQLPRCIESLKRLRHLWASNNEMQGLPTFLANLPALFELQLQGCPDLKFPPPDILLQGRQVIVDYLVSNMRYEISVDTAQSETRVLILETRAKEDADAAELAEEIIVPLRELAEKALLKAEKAEMIASDLRAQVEIFDMGDIDNDAALLPEEKQAHREKLESEFEELQDTLNKAERKAELFKAEAETARAKAVEAEEIARALRKIAEESEEVAREAKKERT